MLGGMSGGGMGFLFHPSRKREAQNRLQEIMSAEKQRYGHGIPFAIEPVVYDFAISEQGSSAEVLMGEKTVLPQSYYALTVPSLLRKDPRGLTAVQRKELEHLSAASRTNPALDGMLQRIVDRPSCPIRLHRRRIRIHLEQLLDRYGFDRIQHDQIRADLRSGRVGLAANRLPISTTITDVEDGDVVELSGTYIGPVSQDWSRCAGVRGCCGPYTCGRGRKPLDERRRHGEGTLSVLPVGRSSPHLCSRRIWQRAAVR